MPLFPAIIYARVVFITAMINLITLSLILLSCRCVGMWGLTSKITKHSWYKRFFKWHCYVWYVFLPSVIIHAVFALTLMGIPF